MEWYYQIQEFWKEATGKVDITACVGGLIAIALAGFSLFYQIKIENNTKKLSRTAPSQLEFLLRLNERFNICRFLFGHMKVDNEEYTLRIFKVKEDYYKFLFSKMRIPTRYFDCSVYISYGQSAYNLAIKTSQLIEDYNDSLYAFINNIKLNKDNYWYKPYKDNIQGTIKKIAQNVISLDKCIHKNNRLIKQFKAAVIYSVLTNSDIINISKEENYNSTPFIPQTVQNYFLVSFEDKELSSSVIKSSIKQTYGYKKLHKIYLGNDIEGDLIIDNCIRGIKKAINLSRGDVIYVDHRKNYSLIYDDKKETKISPSLWCDTIECDNSSLLIDVILKRFNFKNYPDFSLEEFKTTSVYNIELMFNLLYIIDAYHILQDVKII